VEDSSVNGEETRSALPAKYEQSEQVSACDASICLQLSASAWLAILVLPEPNAVSASRCGDMTTSRLVA